MAFFILPGPPPSSQCSTMVAMLLLAPPSFTSQNSAVLSLLHTQSPYEIAKPYFAMESQTSWSGLQQNPTPTNISYSYQPSVASYPPPTYTAQFYSYPQNPNPSTTDPQSSLGAHEIQSGVSLEPVVNPPGVDSYPRTSSNSVTYLSYDGNANFTYGQGHVVDSSSLASSSGYYWDPNAQNWAAREAVRQYGVDPVSYGAGISVPSSGSEQLAIANPSTSWWTNTTTQPQGNGAWKKRPKKPKTKIVQSAYCEVCKIDCTSKDVLDQHKLGKKHKKNVEKLREALRPPQVPTPAPSNTFIGPQLQTDNSKSVSGSKSRRKAVETPEDLMKKKRKVLEGGAAAEAVRECAICNVVCNSETVFNYHLAGQKHAAMVKKQASEQLKISL